MRNVLIMGTGRSGTSMTAGVLARAGYFMGEHLNPGNETNPKGQFEDREVNRINESLLSQITPARPSNIIGDLFFKSRLIYGQRWLARVPLGVSIPSPSHIEERIKALIKNEPFCFKDPRFSYTLPVWRRLIKDGVFICVFRHPGVTVASILKQKEKVPHLRSISINVNQIFQVWELMYSHITRIHYRQGGEWLFFHYNQFFEDNTFYRLETTLGAKVDRGFVQSSLNRSTPVNNCPARIQSLYDELCDLADYSEK
jgi:hypothetical protein